VSSSPRRREPALRRLRAGLLRPPAAGGHRVAGRVASSYANGRAIERLSRSNLLRHEFLAGSLPPPVHGAEKDAQLIAHRRIGFKIGPPKLAAQLLGGAMHCRCDKPLFQFTESFAFDPHRGVPVTVPSFAAADGVAREMDRLPANVPDQLSLGSEERMLPVWVARITKKRP